MFFENVLFTQRKYQALSFLMDGFHQNVIILLVFAFLIRPAFSHTLAITCFFNLLWWAVVFIQCYQRNVALSASKLFQSLSLQALAGSLICRGAWLIEFHARTEFRRESTVMKHSNDSNELVRERYLRYKAEAKAEADNGFVAYLCHEIRNPFNGIVGYAEFTVDQIRALLEGRSFSCANQTLAGSEGSSPQEHQQHQLLQQSPDINGNSASHAQSIDDQTAALTQVQEWCSRILECSGHVSEILDNALDLSKLEAGNLVLHNQPLNMHQLVHEVFLLLNSTMQSPQVNFEARVKEDLWVLGDRLRWKQLLVNIVSNAFKFTKNGFVRVGIELTPALGLMVEVCDTGPGIAKDDYKLLFSKYSQVGIRGSLKKAKKKRKGTGLGLAIAQLIARLLGAEIQVESPWTDGWAGSRFFFYVPPRHAIQCDPPSDDDESGRSDDDIYDDTSSTDAAEAAELAGGDVWRVALPDRVVRSGSGSSASKGKGKRSKGTSSRNGSGSGGSGSGSNCSSSPLSGFNGGGALRTVTIPSFGAPSGNSLKNNRRGDERSGSSSGSGTGSGSVKSNGSTADRTRDKSQGSGSVKSNNSNNSSGSNGSTTSPTAAHKLLRMSGSGDSDLLGSNDNSSTGSITMHTLTHKEGHTLVFNKQQLFHEQLAEFPWLRNLRILVVDDDQMNLIILKAKLQVHTDTSCCFFASQSTLLPFLCSPLPPPLVLLCSSFHPFPSCLVLHLAHQFDLAASIPSCDARPSFRLGRGYSRDWRGSAADEHSD
jgi:signal transduction histidine kinase